MTNQARAEQTATANQASTVPAIVDDTIQNRDETNGTNDYLTVEDYKPRFKPFPLGGFLESHNLQHDESWQPGDEIN